MKTANHTSKKSVLLILILNFDSEGQKEQNFLIVTNCAGLNVEHADGIFNLEVTVKTDRNNKSISSTINVISKERKMQDW